jgi:hypothetical protein
MLSLQHCMVEHLGKLSVPCLLPPAEHFIACHTAGAVLNFQVHPTGATAWLQVIRGRLVGCLAAA